MKRKLFALMLLTGFLLYGCTPKKADQPAAATSADGLDRTSLPIKEPVRPTYTELDVRNVTAPPRFEVKAPERCSKCGGYIN